jgi:hypothetical protein
MDPMTIHVEGLTKLRRELKKVDAGLAKELNKVGKDVAEIVAATARVDAPRLTGRLAGTIKAGSTAGGAYVKAGGVPYAAPIHWGWRKHNIAPQPFLYEALDARRDEVIEKYVAGLNALIDGSITAGSAD